MHALQAVRMFETLGAKVVRNAAHSNHKLVVWNIHDIVLVYFVRLFNRAVPFVRNHLDFQQAGGMIRQLAGLAVQVITEMQVPSSTLHELTVALLQDTA